MRVAAALMHAAQATRDRVHRAQAALPACVSRRCSNLDFGRSWRRAFSQPVSPLVITREQEGRGPKPMSKRRYLRHVAENLRRAERQTVHVAIGSRRLLRATAVIVRSCRMMAHADGRCRRNVTMMLYRGVAMRHCGSCNRNNSKAQQGEHAQETSEGGQDHDGG